MAITSFKILVAGVGGVGGYYGGLLARHYHEDPAVSVYFMARGTHLQKIRQDGLFLKCHKGEFHIHPDKASENPEDFGRCDLILFCVKSYHLEETAVALSQNIDENTFVLPVLNGVETAGKLKTMLPEARVIPGFVYVNSHKSAPGVVEQRGIEPLLNFGTEKEGQRDRLARLVALFSQAGISAKLHDDINIPLWEKFILVGSTASLTTYYGEGVKEISTRPDFKAIVHEIYRLALAKGINLPPSTTQNIIEKVRGFKTGVKSSLQLDFEKNKANELEVFTGYIAKESNKLGLQAPVANRMYSELKRLSDQKT